MSARRSSLSSAMIHIAGEPARKGHPALTGIFFHVEALLGYAANVAEHTYNDPELAAAIWKRIREGKRRKGR